MKESITKGEQTRQGILAAAKQLFISQGFNATSIRQIAQEVGITPAAIYNHYETKDQLFTVLLQSEAPYEALSFFDRFEAISVENSVRHILSTALVSLTDHQDYFRLALIDAQEREGMALTAMLPEVLPRGERWYQQLASLDAETGQPRLRNVPYPVFARTMLSLIYGFMLTQLVIKTDRLTQFDSIDWPENLIDVFLHGVLKPPA